MKISNNLSDDLVFAVAPMSGSQIESDATVVLKKYSPALLKEPDAFDIVNFFDFPMKDDFKLDTAVQHLADGVEGQAWPDGRVFVSELTYEMACSNIGRGRFTIAHECYHGLKHRGQIRHVLVHTGQATLYRRKSLSAFRDPEWQADRFAAALLMPAPMVTLLASRVRQDQIVKAISSTFQVSYAFTA